MTVSLAAIAALLPAATFTPSPSPSDVLRPGLDPYDVSPGLLGFLAIFAVAAVCVLGWMSLNRKVRRMRFAERAEGVAADGAEPGAESGGGPGGEPGGGPGATEPGAEPGAEPGGGPGVTGQGTPEPGGGAGPAGSGAAAAGPAGSGAAGDDAQG